MGGLLLATASDAMAIKPGLQVSQQANGNYWAKGSACDVGR